MGLVPQQASWTPLLALLYATQADSEKELLEQAATLYGISQRF